MEKIRGASMPKCKGMSEAKEEIFKQKDFNLNECASSPNVEHMMISKNQETGIEQADGNFSESCLKAERETVSLVDNGMKNKKKVMLEPLDCEVFGARRVLRSGSLASDPAKSEKRHGSMKTKRKCGQKGDVSKDDNMGEISGRSSVSEVKEVVVVDDVVPKENHGDGFGSQVRVEYRSEVENRSFAPHETEVEVKRKRGRPRKVQISSQSDDQKGKLVRDENEENLIGGSCVEEKTELKLEHGQSAEANKIPGADSRSQVVVEIKDERSYDENGNAEPRDEEPKVKRKRGRPRKVQISCQSNASDSNANCELVRTQDVCSQLSVDRLNLKHQCGGPPKTDETAVDLCNKKETSDQSLSHSSDESRRPKRKCGGWAKGPESDGGNCQGRKVVRKRGRPPTSQKNRKPGEMDESNCEAKKRLKRHESPLDSQQSIPLVDGERRIGEQQNQQNGAGRQSKSESKEIHESPLDSQQNVPLVDGEMRIGEQQNQQNEAGRRSKSESKKMLSDRIVQLLLAAGWTVEYRPRNGRDYQDAVYVNPEGKTHWSVTKAYTVYKKHVESSMKDQANSTSSSGFGLLPEEDLHLLGRNTLKKRCDKGGKHMPKWKDRDINEKRAHHGKKMQKKRKGRHGSHNLEKISVCERKIKREQKHKRKRCALSARSSPDDVDSKENGYVLFEGKRTILGWMIDSAIVPLNGKVQCMDCKETEVLLEGRITKEGIRCNCCDKMFSVLDFEVHAGGKCNQPFKSLYLEGENSLLQCLLKSWNEQSETQLKGFHFVDFGGGDPNDDTCGICGDGGGLICCDGCPSAFHQSCLDIKNFPSGAWFCCYCSCKFCGKVKAANHDGATLPPLSSCRLCEEKYHQACVNHDCTVPGLKSTDSFCGRHCQELFEGLELLIGVNHPLPGGFSWTFLRRFGLPNEVPDCDISEKITYNAKLAVAFSVMDECFSPLVDHRSGVNLLENIVYNYGSNFHRLDYSNFLTAVLERGDEVIGVASLRIHGNQLAEMPFIGTRYMYRRQGMCRRLMDGIESALSSLKVDKLVIPAVPALMDTWTSGFGFKPIHGSGKKIIKNLNLLVFPGVDMLEKPLAKEKIATPCYLPLPPEKSSPVDVEFKESADEQNCLTADDESTAYPVDNKSMTGEEGDTNTESNLKVLNASLEEKEEIEKHTDKEADHLLTDIVDSCIDSQVSDDSHADQTDTKIQDIGDDGAEESDCYVIDHPQPLGGNDGRRKEINNESLTLNKEVNSKLRASPRLVQRSWKTSRVN